LAPAWLAHRRAEIAQQRRLQQQTDRLMGCSRGLLEERDHGQRRGGIGDAQRHLREGRQRVADQQARVAALEQDGESRQPLAPCSPP
jgi:hypothetical protein